MNLLTWCAAIATASLVACATPQQRDQQELLRLVKDDLAVENAECGVYFAKVAEGLRHSMPAGKEREKEVADWSKLSKDAFDASRYLIGDQKSLAYMKIKRMMNEELEHIAIVQAEYKNLCKDLMDTPKKRWDYWEEKEMQREKELQSTPK